MQFMGEKLSSIAPGYNIVFSKKDWDGILRTEDGTVFKIHRVILSQYEYFRALFSFEANNNRKDILMKEIGSQTLRQILQYIYEGTLQLDEEDALDLMIAADYLLLDDLLEHCRDFAIRRMTPSNCLTLLTTALRYEHLNILPECLRYVKIHFEIIVKNFPDKIAYLPIEVLTELLKDNFLNVTSEDTVWTAIVIWVKADIFKRNQYVPDLLNCIRFEEEKSLILKVMHSVTGIFNQFCIESNSFPHRPSEPSFLKRILYRETASRLPKYLHVVVCCRISHSAMYLTCDEELDYWRNICDTPFIPDVIVPIGKHVYLFSTGVNVVQRYDLLDDSMIPVISNLNRINFCVVELHNKIYALGGCTEIRQNGQPYILYDTTVECYDPDSDSWKFVRSMETTLIIGLKPVKMAAAGICGRLYVIEYIHNSFQSIVEMQVYDPNTNIWNTVINSPRLFNPTSSVVAFENRLYLVGGSNDAGLIHAEEYDPVMGVWMGLPDLPFKYLKPKLLVLGGRLLGFDNYHENNCNQDRHPVSPAVYWDGVTRAWKITDKSFAFYNNLEQYRFGILNDSAVVRELVNRSRRATVQWGRISSSE